MIGSEWKEIPIHGDDDEMRLGEIVALDTITVEDVISYTGNAISRVERGDPHLASRDPCRVLVGGSWLMEALAVSHDASYDGQRTGELMTTDVFGFRRKGTPPPDDSNAPQNCLSGLYASLWRRATMPCSPRHIGLAHAKAADPKESYDVVDSVWPRMLCPFVMEEDKRVFLDHLPEYVRWTAKNADGGPKDELEVAKALLAFLQEADAVMAEAWKDRKAYDLALAKRDLAPWLK